MTRRLRTTTTLRAPRATPYMRGAAGRAPAE
jgi:hypothetical protein